MVLFPTSGDSAGRGNGLVTMMNSTFLLTTAVLEGALPAATKDLPQENVNSWSRLAQALLITWLKGVGGGGGQVHGVALASLAALMLMVITEQQAGKRVQKDY